MNPREIPAEPLAALERFKLAYRAFEKRASNRQASIEPSSLPPQVKVDVHLSTVAIIAEARRHANRVNAAVRAFRRGAKWADERRLLADALWARHFVDGLFELATIPAVNEFRPGVH